MPDQPRAARHANDDDRRQLDHLRRTLAANCPSATRREVIRWSAITAGAVATARLGTGAAVAAGTPRVSASAQDGEADTDAEIVVPFNPYGEQVTLDPHRATNWGPFWVLFPNVWGGLMRYTETGAVTEDLAESYEVSEDGLTYTFTLRPDLLYANGNPVLAEHFVASWRRALDPNETSPMASFMSLVEGYGPFIDGESDEIGFEAIDDVTVAITLAEPYSYFLSYLAAFVWSVVDPAVIEAEGDNFVLADAGTGPWRVTAFDPAESITMERNENHWEGTPASLAQITWPIVTGPEADQTALDLYRDEDAASADVPISLLEEVTGDETLNAELVRIEPSGSTRSLAMDFTKEPFDNVGVRRAFAQAIDRDRWANEIYQGTYVPTTAFTPPSLATVANYEAPEGLAFDVDAARAELDAAGFEDRSTLPAITFYQSADEPAEELERGAALVEMLNENLEISISHDTSRTQSQIDDLRRDEGGIQLTSMWWWVVTDTPHLLSYALRTDSPYMAGWFNWNADLEDQGDFTPGADAAEFDELTAQADRELDESARNEAYRAAEELALRNAVYAPLGNWVQMFVQKPWLTGTKQGPWTGRLPIRFDSEVVVLRRDAALG